MKTIKANDARTQWADLLNRVYFKDESFTIERHGQAVAVVVPVGEWEKMQAGVRSVTLDQAATTVEVGLEGLDSTLRISYCDDIKSWRIDVAANIQTPFDEKEVDAGWKTAAVVHAGRPIKCDACGATFDGGWEDAIREGWRRRGGVFCCDCDDKLQSILKK